MVSAVEEDVVREMFLALSVEIKKTCLVLFRPRVTVCVHSFARGVERGQEGSDFFLLLLFGVGMGARAPSLLTSTVSRLSRPRSAEKLAVGETCG